MPHRAEHAQQAQRNVTYARWLLRMQPGDIATRQWATVAIFYAAMHLVEVHFDAFGLEHVNHGDRHRHMADPGFRVPRHIDNAYRQLYRYGYGARYHFMEPSVAAVQSLLSANLMPIAAFVSIAV